MIFSFHLDSIVRKENGCIWRKENPRVSVPPLLITHKVQVQETIYSIFTTANDYLNTLSGYFAWIYVVQNTLEDHEITSRFMENGTRPHRNIFDFLTNIFMNKIPICVCKVYLEILQANKKHLKLNVLFFRMDYLVHFSLSAYVKGYLKDMVYQKNTENNFRTEIVHVCCISELSGRNFNTGLWELCSHTAQCYYSKCRICGKYRC